MSFLLVQDIHWLHAIAAVGTAQLVPVFCWEMHYCQQLMAHAVLSAVDGACSAVSS